MSTTEALIAKLSAMRGDFLGDGINESVNRRELHATACGNCEFARQCRKEMK